MRKPNAGITLQPLKQNKTNQSSLGVQRNYKKAYMSTPNHKNDYIDMSSQNIIANLHPDRESNVEIFKRYNPDYNMPMN